MEVEKEEEKGVEGTLCGSPGFMKAVFIPHMCPVLDFASVVWFTGYTGDIRL